MTGPTQNQLATYLFVLIGAVVGLDLLSDVGSGVEPLHVALEGLGTVAALIGAGLFYRYHRAELADRAYWRQQAEALLQSSGSSVERQLDTWSLSPAEREVTVLLLKGLAFKEIAAVRNTTERTAREQARAVYKKAGVAGRAELSAWFIEDLVGGP